MPLAQLLAVFSHLPHYPQVNWALLVLIPRWVVLCTFQDHVGLSNELSFMLIVSHSLNPHNPHRFLQSEVLRLYFPVPGPCIVWSVWLPTCSSWFIHMQVFNCLLCQLLPHPVLHPLPCHESSLPQLPISIPPTGLDKCFLFNCLVVRLPYSLIS